MSAKWFLFWELTLDKTIPPLDKLRLAEVAGVLTDRTVDDSANREAELV